MHEKQCLNILKDADQGKEIKEARGFVSGVFLSYFNFDICYGDSSPLCGYIPPPCALYTFLPLPLLQSRVFRFVRAAEQKKDQHHRALLDRMPCHLRERSGILYVFHLPASSKFTYSSTDTFFPKLDLMRNFAQMASKMKFK